MCANIALECGHVCVQLLFFVHQRNMYNKVSYYMSKLSRGLVALVTRVKQFMYGVNFVRQFMEQQHTQDKKGGDKGLF